MNKLSKSFLCLSMLFAVGMRADDCCDTSSDCSTSCSDRCVTLFVPRSAGDNLVRQAHHNGYQFGNDCFYGEFSAEYRYQRSFREERIAKSLFGAQTLNFVGSKVADRDNENKQNLIAENFGLASDANSSLGFCPRIQNHVVDFQLYLGLDEFWEGLYLQVNAPLVHSKWELNAGAGKSSDCNTDCDSNCDSSALPALSSTTAHAAGCMDIISEGTVAAASTFEEALGGDFKFGDMQEAWKYGRFKFCEQDDTKLADLHFNLGYNFYECPDYHFGAFLKVVAPTGTDLGTDCAVKNVFHPVIGEDHWRLGGGVTAHAELWNCDDEQFVNMYFEGYLVHMFKECQVRSFDFKDKGCMSRYMLLKEFNADKTYAGKLVNAINFATRKAEVQVDIQGEASLEFVYSNDCGFSAGLGYNIYGKSEEDVCIGDAACDLGNRTFGFKGCSSIEGQIWQVDDANAAIFENPQADPQATYILNSTQSNATAYSCGTVDSAVTLSPETIATEDFVVVAVCDSTPTAGGNVADVTIAQDSATGTATVAVDGVTGLEANPTLVTKADLDVNSGSAESQLSHKIFGHLDYEWSDCEWTPYLRAGAEVEFARSKDVGTMNAWGIFVGGGVSF